MKKIKIMLIVFILIVFVNFSGCFEDDEDNNKIDDDKLTDKEKLLGTWTNTSSYNGQTFIRNYTFFSNNTYTVSSNLLVTYNGTWEIINNNLSVTVENKSSTFRYVFSDDDKTITITDLSSGYVDILTKIS